MWIAIVASDEEFAKKVEAFIGDFYREISEEVTVRRFSEGSSLLEELVQERDWDYDAYILEVEMSELDGLELARQIREREENANIIFLSSFEKYALPAYKVRARDYIMKERYRDEIPTILDTIRIEKRNRNQEDCYTIQVGNTIERLRIDEIRYLTKEKKYVVFWGIEGKMGRERTTLEKAYDRLPHDQFLYISKSCIINMKHIISLKNNVVALDNNMERAISRSMASRVKKEIARYWGK